jgi:sulfhydrogenase subunit alpha
MTHKNERVLAVSELARVEGEGALYIRASGNRVEEARLDIYEPPRFFEAFLRGRAYTEPPDITARICGICPVAYQMSAAPRAGRRAGHRGLGRRVRLPRSRL